MADIPGGTDQSVARLRQLPEMPGEVPHHAAYPQARVVARDRVGRLRERGLDCRILSGDRPEAVAQTGQGIMVYA